MLLEAGGLDGIMANIRRKLEKLKKPFRVLQDIYITELNFKFCSNQFASEAKVVLFEKIFFV